MQIMKPTQSEYIEIRSSKIHSNGIFASKDIPKGTKIIEYMGIKITKAQTDKLADIHIGQAKKDKSKGLVYIFELNKKEDIDGNVSYNTARLINHSCSPNCETTGDDQHIWITSIKNIKKGEELSYDYGYNADNFKDHPCLCKSPNCMKYIIDRKLYSKFKRKLKRLKRKSRASNIKQNNLDS
jgi:uncharacterized protein